ncbi:MAG: Rpn family recombination-promoting nuclease/putative transposase, partial [Bacteroidales bacterium]
MAKHIRFDWAMKRLLRNKANFDVLEGLLSVLLNDTIKIKEVLESASNKADEDDKFNVLDILVKNAKDELVLIEVQNERENDYFHRMNYAQAKLTSEHLYEGDAYGKIKKVISINILYFDLGQGDDYVYVGKTEFKGLHNNDILQLSENQKKVYPIQDVSDIYTTYYLLKVNKFDDVARNSLDEWVYFLKNSEIKDEFTAPGLPEAREKLRRDNLSPAEKQAYEKYIHQKRISENVYHTALEEGRDLAKKEYEPRLESARQQTQEER